MKKLLTLLLLFGIVGCSEKQTEFKYLCKNLEYPNPYIAILVISTKNETMNFMLLYDSGQTYSGSGDKYDVNFINAEYSVSAKDRFDDEMSFNKLTSKLVFKGRDTNRSMICDKEAKPLKI